MSTLMRCYLISTTTWVLAHLMCFRVLTASDDLMPSMDSEFCQNEEKVILQTVFSNYDKSVLPNKHGVHVEVEMHIQDISSLSELTSDFELDVLFSSIWRDPNLSFEQLQTCQMNLTLDLNYLKKIWLPKTCVINSKTAEVRKKTFCLLRKLEEKAGKLF